MANLDIAIVKDEIIRDVYLINKMQNIRKIHLVIIIEIYEFDFFIN